MVNLAVAIKETVHRLAKREIKAETAKTKQAVAQYRRDIARLKRQVKAQQKNTAFLLAQEEKRLGQQAPTESPSEGVRFSARSVRAQRKRLKLSAEQYAKLIGVSPLTVYHWEHGKSRPRQAQLLALVAARKLGRREATAKLEVLKGKEKRTARRVRKLGRKRSK